MRLALLLSVLMATPAFADDEAQPSLRRASVLYAAMAASDSLTTSYCLQRFSFCYETNPLYRWTETNEPVRLVTGAAVDAATIWAVHRFVGRRHPRVATWVLYAATAIRGFAVIRNGQTIHQAHRLNRE